MSFDLDAKSIKLAPLKRDVAAEPLFPDKTE